MCVYVYMYVRMYEVYAWMIVCICICMCIYICICVCMYIHVYMNMCTCIYIYICVYIYMYMCIYTYIHIYIYTWLKLPHVRTNASAALCSALARKVSPLFWPCGALDMHYGACHWHVPKLACYVSIYLSGCGKRPRGQEAQVTTIGNTTTTTVDRH